MFSINQTLRCPVCKERLGERNKVDSFQGFCSECDFYFFFPPNEIKPSSCIARKKRDNVCKCPSCLAKMK
jgi:hypothetical protein